MNIKFEIIQTLFELFKFIQARHLVILFGAYFIRIIVQQNILKPDLY